MKAHIVCIYEAMATKEFTNATGEKISYNELLVRDTEANDPRYSFVAMTVPAEVFGTYTEDDLATFRGKEIIVAGDVSNRSKGGGLKVKVAKIELLKK